MASSTEILVAPLRSERLRSLCSCSFLSVPHPEGIWERHPFWMCRRKCSISLVVWEFPKGLLGTLIQRSMREFKFFSSCSLLVYFSLAEPWSSSLLKICENSRMNEFAVVSALFKVFVIRWQAWNRLSFTSVPGNAKYTWVRCRFPLEKVINQFFS